VVGHVLSREPHPNADRLALCKVAYGGADAVDVVCGAPNVAAGQKIAFAPVGTVMPDGTKLKKAKLRGVVSRGMICSERELEMSDEHAGILVLDDDAPVGAALRETLGAGDTVLEIALTANRGDCASILGIAREVAAHFGGELQLPPLEAPEGSRAVVFNPDLGFSVMVNEEDHLRIQVMRSGLDLQTAWKKVDRIDDMLEEVLLYAYHPRYGYLTACPTNVGTGLRVSVMLHLPALVITEQMDRVFRSMQRINVRGLYGEGSQYTGDFYQVSNQVTLGYSEQDLLTLIGADVAPRIIEYERKARAALLENNRDDLHDEVSRAMGILNTARKISSEETMHHLSKIRLGISLGLIDELDVNVINRLFLQSQPAHLQKLQGRALSTAERQARRASFLQHHLAGKDGASWN